MCKKPCVTVGILLTIFIFTCSIHKAAVSAETQDAQSLAQSIVGENQGLIVHLGCGDGSLTAALRVNKHCLVHGINPDPASIAQARKTIRSQGLYGPVSVQVWDRPFLPYIDNAVNLLVVEDRYAYPKAELLRVLAPGGILREKNGATWSKTIKSPNKKTDEWTHYKHDASGNAVSQDRVLGPPQFLQWTAGPGYTRAHEFTPSLTSLVSSGGRIFYVADEGPVESIREPSAWNLIARDAYNGLLMWKKPLPDWFSRLFIWTRIPPQLNRKLVAVGDRVYITLGYHAPLKALDAATGKTLLTYKDTKGAEEIVCDEGVLVVILRELTKDRVETYRSLLKMTNLPDTPLAERETGQPVIQHFHQVERKAKRSLAAFDAASGKELWRLSGGEVEWIEPMTLCAHEGRVFFQRKAHPADRRRGKMRNEAVCLNLKTGKEIWAAPQYQTQLVCEAGVVCLNKEKIQLLSRDSGEEIWSQPTKLVNIRDVFAADNALWIGGFKPFDTGTKWSGPNWGPYYALERDLATGEVQQEVNTGNPGHHQRCYDSVATNNYILSGRRGTEFIDLDSGDVSYHSWARGTCRYGVMPANGLLYTPPHECGCYVLAKLVGFNALASSRKYDPNPSSAKRREKGPAFGKIQKTQETNSIHDWPTFRGNAARSGATAVVLPEKLANAWQATLGGSLTAPTVADGKVFVASFDRHAIHALDLSSGEEMWRYTTNGPVDSPPTIYKGQVLFGCRDGWVYALRSSDGALAWRFQAARDPRRLVAEGQLESPLPIPGSVLVHDEVLWFTAGRSSFMDGGIDLYRLDPTSGKLLSKKRIYSPDPKTHKQVDPLRKTVIQGSRMDILSSDGQRIFLQDRAFSLNGKPIEKRYPHLFALTGFLDSDWVHRSYWVYGVHPAMKLGSGWDKLRDMPYGRLLSIGENVVYGYGRKVVDWSNEFKDGVYRFFARDKKSKKEQFP
ncbi:PQQ-binding-like beta-propeller repeat protein, partial [bacterium]|nr:PQQ-binding-like beta-propeller repeat protein [bacterium]